MCDAPSGDYRNCEIHVVVVIVIGLWNANQCFVVLNILFLNFFFIHKI